MFIVQEIQTNGGIPALLTPLIYGDSNEADSAYYAKLSAAAISNVELHTIMMHDENGMVLKNDCYYHTPQGE